MASHGGTTTDHDEIRRWAEARGARPARVIHTGRDDPEQDPGIIRLDFTGHGGQSAGALEDITWDEWFQAFDDGQLALVYQETTADGEQSNFNKLVGRETVERREHGDSHASRHEARTPAKRGSRKTAAKTGTRRAAGKTATKATARSGRGATSATKKAGAKKTTAKKSAMKQTTAKKSTAKKAAAKKTTAKQTTGKKTASKRGTTKTATKRSATRTSTARRATQKTARGRGR